MTARRPWLRMAGLALGAIAFLFPFYYMIVGSLQKKSDTSLGGALPDPGNLSLDNYREINAAIDGAKTLVWNGPLGAFELAPFDAATLATLTDPNAPDDAADPSPAMLTRNAS